MPGMGGDQEFPGVGARPILSQTSPRRLDKTRRSPRQQADPFLIGLGNPSIVQKLLPILGQANILAGR